MADYFFLKESLLQVIPIAREHRVTLCLEMDLPPKWVKMVIEDFNSRVIKVAYDSGNSTALGYDVNEEFYHYGNKIKVIHVKDRLFNGPSVKFGTGHVNFTKLFHNIDLKAKEVPLTLQPYREEQYEDDLVTLQQQVDFLKPYLTEL